jgi:hypothetical protein
MLKIRLSGTASSRRSSRTSHSIADHERLLVSRAGTYYPAPQAFGGSPASVADKRFPPRQAADDEARMAIAALERAWSR